MKRPDRKPLRPISKTGLSEKQFKPVFAGLRKRVDLRKVAHPLIVVADLRRGSLASLDRYMAKHRGIPDHQVAVELRKLIWGTRSRSRFRLVIVEHPDRPADVGGRPRASYDALTAEQQEIAERYHEVLISEGKRYRAEEIVQEEFQLSRSTIKRILKKAKEIDRRAAERDKAADQISALVHRREEALAQLRCKNSSGDS